MNIDDLKDQLGDKYEPLKTYIDDLTGQRDAARNESIEKRKALKARVAELEGAQSSLMERLGVESLDDLDGLADPKGQAEAVKQFEVRIKRMERELAEKADALKQSDERYRSSRLDVMLNKAMSEHQFVDSDLVSDYLKGRIEWESDDPMLKVDGKLLPLTEGAAHLAQTKPHLLKSTGAGGSGYIPQGNGQAKNPWASETLNLTEQARIAREDPQKAERLMAAAQPE